MTHRLSTVVDDTTIHVDPVTGKLYTDEPAAAVVAAQLAVDEALLPTAGQKAALAGTSGTPGAGNPYVTDADSRLSDTVPTTRTVSTTAPLAGGGDLSANRTLSIPKATSLADGYLASVDWSTFNAKVPATRSVTAGTGLSGGGDLSADRSLAVSFGTSSSTACVGNDSRLSDSRTPSAHASTHLPGGTDALTTAAAGATTPGDSAAVGTAASFARSDHKHSIAAFGTAAATFCQGNDSRLSDSRAPSGAAGGDLTGTFPNPSVVAGSTSVAGKLQLTDSTASTSATTAATPNAVKTAYDLASTANTTASAALPKAGGTMTGAIDMGSHKVTSVTDPTSAQDAATKAYVDANTGGGSSSTVTSELFTVPASPSTYDDEFTSDTSANYTWYDSNGSTVITPSGTIDPYATITSGVVQQFGVPRRSWLAAQIRNTNVSTHMVKAWTPNTNDFVWCRVAHAIRSAVAASDAAIVLELMAATGGHPDIANLVEFGLVPNSGNGNHATRIISSKTVASVATAILAGGAYATNGVSIAAYFGIHKRGTNYDFWVGDAQGRLTWWGTTTHASTMAYLGIRFTDNTASGTKPGNPVFLVDFIRVAQNTAVFLP